MSAQYHPLKTYKVIDPATNIDSARSYSILSGSKFIQYKPNVSTNYSNIQVAHSVPPASEGILTDRNVKMKWAVNFSIVGTSLGGGPLIDFQAGTVGLRKWPIANTISTQSVTINNTAVSNNASDLIDPMTRYAIKRNERNTSLSTSPVMADNYQNYNDGLGYNNNPLAWYGNNPSEMSRGAFNYTGGSSPNLVVNYNVSTGANFTYNVSENIFLDPFIWGDYEASAFIGVKSMDFTFTLGDLRQMLSINQSSANFSTVTATFASAPQLLFRYLTPNELVSPFVAQKPYVYSWTNVTRYTTSSSTSMVPNAQQTLISNNLQLNSIPQRCYFYVREANNNRTYFSSDAYCSCDNLNITWINNNGLLASASKQDLYGMCAKNGLQMNYPQWNYFSGSIVAVDFGRDIGMSELESPGLIGQYQITVQMQVTNPNQSVTITNPTLFIISCEAGSFTIVNGNSVVNTGVVTRDDILNSRASETIDYNTHKNLYGGSIIGSIRSFLENAYGKYKKYEPEARAVAKLAKPHLPKNAQSVLNQLGYGKSGGKRRGRGGLDSDDEREEKEKDRKDKESPVKSKIKSKLEKMKKYNKN